MHLVAWLPHVAVYGPAATDLFSLLTALLQAPVAKSKRSQSSGDSEKPPKCAAALCLNQ